MERLPNKREAEEALAIIKPMGYQLCGWKVDYVTVDLSDMEVLHAFYRGKSEFIVVDTGHEMFAINVTGSSTSWIVKVFTMRMFAMDPELVKGLKPAFRDTALQSGNVTSKAFLRWLVDEAFAK